MYLILTYSNSNRTNIEFKTKFNGVFKPYQFNFGTLPICVVKADDSTTIVIDNKPKYCVTSIIDEIDMRSDLCTDEVAD